MRQNAYLGATVGLYANRIRGATLGHDGKLFTLAANQGEHQLHGGPEGFHNRRWQQVEQDQTSVLYRLHSADGDQGYPGNLVADARYIAKRHYFDNSQLYFFAAYHGISCNRF